MRLAQSPAQPATRSGRLPCIVLLSSSLFASVLVGAQSRGNVSGCLRSSVDCTVFGFEVGQWAPEKRQNIDYRVALRRLSWVSDVEMYYRELKLAHRDRHVLFEHRSIEAQIKQ